MRRRIAANCSRLAWEALFDCSPAQRPHEVPMWSGLACWSCRNGPGRSGGPPRPSALPLKDLEIALIRKAVQDARGNVMAAAKLLGISRATVYQEAAGRR